MPNIVDYIRAAPNPNDETYLAHAVSVRQFDRGLFNFAMATLEEHSFRDAVLAQVRQLGGNSDNALIEEVCAGSDGREEKGVCSPFDLVVYLVGTGLPNEECKRLGELVNESFIQPRGYRVFENVEVKLLEGQVSLYNGIKDATYPDRVMDSQVLTEYANDIVQAAKIKLVDELRYSNDGKFGSSVVSRLRHSISLYRQISRNGVQKGRGGEAISHFDIERGEAYFDNSVNRRQLGSSSFKQNLLRLVQNTLTREIVRHVKKLDDAKAKSFLMLLPTNISDRLSYLESEGVFNKGKLPHEKVELLRDNYLYFLWQYHRSEHEFFHNQGTVVAFDREEVAERRDHLLHLAERAVTG